MNIACATDNNYVQHCGVMLTSLFENNKGQDIHIYVLTEGLSDSNQYRLESIVANYGGHFHYCPLETGMMQDFPQGGLNYHITLAAYNRLWVSRVLPVSEDKVIYLDCDVIVRSSLKELWETDITGYALGAVEEFWDIPKENFVRLQYEPRYSYFNSGVLLINLSYWREKDVPSQLFHYIKSSREKIIFHDQDALNAVLHARWLALPFRWNLLTVAYYADREKIVRPVLQNAVFCAVETPGVIHFFCKPKPWDEGCCHPCRQEYFNYLKLTEWKNFKVPFHWSNYIRRCVGNLLRKVGLRKKYYIKTDQ